MRIVAAEVLPYALPLATRLETARGAITHRAGCILRLRAEDGSLGIGDAAPHPHDVARSSGALRDALAAEARWLVGARLAHADRLVAAASRLGRAAASGIDLALRDLCARVRGESLVELLGGARREVVASALLGEDPAADARAALAAGFRVAKLKAPADPHALPALVDAIRGAAPGLALRIDANGAWGADLACAALAGLPRDGIEWLEQPVPAWDLDALARVRDAAQGRGLRIAADEAVTGPEAVRRIASARAADVVVLKLVQVGGLRRALAAAEVAAASGLDVAVTTAIDSGVGTAAALHLAAVLQARPAVGGGAPPAAGVATGGLLARDLLREPLVPRARMALPAGPGLGVVLDESALSSSTRAATQDGGA